MRASPGDLPTPGRRLRGLSLVEVPAALLVGAAVAAALAAAAAFHHLGIAVAVLASFAAGAVAAALWFGSVIAAAAALASRFAAGERTLRLDPTAGPRSFRRLATILNRIADSMVERELRYDLVAEATGDALWDWDLLAGTHTWSGSAEALFGVAPPAMAGDPGWWIDRLHPEDRESVLARALAAREGTARLWSGEYRFRHADGDYRWFWDRCVILRGPDGAAIRVIGCMTDVTVDRQARHEVWRLANHDILTGLPNRLMFQCELDKALAAAKRTGTSLALLLVDVDHFKDVNDTLGHDAGDALLVATAERLRQVVGRAGAVARIGGDEFAVLTRPGHAAPPPVDLAQAILAALTAPATIRGRTVRIRATIGIARAPEQADTAKDLLKNADLALYQAKAAGRNRFAVFGAELRRDFEERAKICAEVEEGLKAGAFFPCYQPKISLITGEICGFEALLRWRRADGLVHAPGAMLAAFEKPELAGELGRQMSAQVLADMACWQRQGLPFKHVAINVSAAEFRAPDFADRLLAQLDAAGLPTSSLAVEVTETVLLGRDGEILGPTLERMHRAGVRLALDDFGTGYASLIHLQRFPVDEIKIDHSFVASLTADAGSRAIVAAMLGLGQRLGKDVVAEGVETLEQAGLLRAAGCTQVQGFLFARPMPAADVPGYLATAPQLRARAGRELRAAGL